MPTWRLVSSTAAKRGFYREQTRDGAKRLRTSRILAGVRSNQTGLTKGAFARLQARGGCRPGADGAFVTPRASSRWIDGAGTINSSVWAQRRVKGEAVGRAFGGVKASCLSGNRGKPPKWAEFCRNREGPGPGAARPRKIMSSTQAKASGPGARPSTQNAAASGWGEERRVCGPGRPFCVQWRPKRPKRKKVNWGRETCRTLVKLPPGGTLAQQGKKEMDRNLSP